MSWSIDYSSINIGAHRRRLKRRRRWLISAQDWSAATTLGSSLIIRNNPERVRQPPNPFRVHPSFFIRIPRVLAALEPWAEISERLRRYSYLNATNGHH